MPLPGLRTYCSFQFPTYLAASFHEVLPSSEIAFWNVLVLCVFLQDLSPGGRPVPTLSIYPLWVTLQLLQRSSAPQRCESMSHQEIGGFLFCAHFLGKNFPWTFWEHWLNKSHLFKQELRDEPEFNFVFKRGHLLFSLLIKAISLKLFFCY